MFDIRIGLVALLALATWLFIWTALEGYRASRTYLEIARNNHRRYRYAFELVLLVAVVAIAIYANTRHPGALPPDTALQRTHWFFVTAFLVTYALARFRFTGKRSVRHHKVCVYFGVIPMYAGMMITGLLILL